MKFRVDQLVTRSPDNGCRPISNSCPFIRMIDRSPTKVGKLRREPRNRGRASSNVNFGLDRILLFSTARAASKWK